MAYVETRKRKNGVAYVVEFRRSGRVYKLSLDRTYNIKDARFIAAAIDSAIASEKKGVGLDAQTRLIFENLSPDMRRRLERVGLLAIAETMTLGEAILLFEREYFPNLNQQTQSGYRLALDNFIKYIGDSSYSVEKINDVEIKNFIQKLRLAYAKNTATLRASQVKTFFRFLEKKNIISISPFNEVPIGQLVSGRRHYINAETIERIAANLDLQRQTLLYLYRYAGLRRSEPYLLTYAHVDLTRRRLTIPTPKTARFAGHEERIAPIEAPLARLLRKIIGDRTDDELIFSKRLDPRAFKSQLPAGARAFQDLRVSCENDWLERRIPAHVVAAWIGHHVNVQARHYAVVLDAYFEEIATTPIE